MHPVEPARRAVTVEEFCQGLRPRLLGALTLQYGYHVAEEITQETLTRVYEHWETVRELDSSRAWAYRVAFNLARSVLRRRLAERRALTRLGPPRADVPTGLDHADVLALRAAVARLPRQQRTALLLRYYADLSVAETSAVMRCTPATVKSYTRDALAGLRAGELSAHGGRWT